MNDAPSPLTLSARAASLARPPNHGCFPAQIRGIRVSEEEAAERLRRYGPNTFPEPPRRSLVRILLAQLASPLIYLLLAAALAALVLGEVANALFIGSVLLLNSAIGGVQEWQAEENSAALRSAIKGLSRVLRGGP